MTAECSAGLSSEIREEERETVSEGADALLDALLHHYHQ